MNLISCENCGVVLNKDFLRFPCIEDEDGNIDTDNAVWDGNTWIAVTKCPVCKDNIPAAE